MRLSIVVNTYNREPYLRRLLAALDRLAGCEVEVVIVNGPSTDGTARLLAEYASRIKSVECPTRNLSHSRNLGIAAAAGDIVAFIDDDALPVDEAWAARYVEAFIGDADEKIGALGGPVWHHDTQWKEFDGGLTSDYGFQVFDVAKGRPQSGRWWPRVQGCNCAFRRSALRAIGGFDEFFVYYHDETDVCIRMARAGFTTAHLPDNGVRHYPAPSERRTSKYDRNWFVVTRSDTYFALKNGGDGPIVRLARTVAGAPRKHYFREIVSYFAHGEIGPRHWAGLMTQWGTGFASGFRAGLARRRFTATFDTEPPAFVSFLTKRSCAPRTIVLLTQSIPGQAGYGGIGRYTYDLACALHERGHRVHVICRAPSERVHNSPGFTIHGVTEAALTQVQHEGGPGVTGKNVRYALAVARTLQALHRAGETIDVVHASNWDAEALAAIRSRLFPVVLTLVSPLAQVIRTEAWQMTDDLRRSLALDRWQIFQADHVVLPSDGVLDSYRSLMGIDRDDLGSVSVVPLGIVPDRAPLAARPDGRLCELLFVGRLERRKGIHVLLAALPSLLTRFTGWECHLVGDDTVSDSAGETHKARFLSAHAGAPWLPRVHFHGAVSEATLRERYRACDVFTAPSLFESFGLIFHEAMQYGKPVVGCRTGGVPETVADGEDGLLVEPDLSDQLEAALARLMGDAGLRQRLGEAARERVMTRQNAATMAKGFVDVYEAVIARLGDERTRARAAAWPMPLSFATGGRFERQGDWQIREAFPGERYLVAEEPGAALSWELPAGAVLELCALSHSWSGVLAIEVDGLVSRLVNLYRADGVEPLFRIQLPLPASPAGLVRVRLIVHAERHPEAFARQIWLRHANWWILADEAVQDAPPCPPVALASTAEAL